MMMAGAILVALGFMGFAFIETGTGRSTSRAAHIAQTYKAEAEGEGEIIDASRSHSSMGMDRDRLDIP
jgi:hypothetical protein